MLVERFPRWVESVELLPASARYSALQHAAESLGSGLTGPAAIDLVAYAVGRDGGQAFERVRAAVSAGDPSFAAAADDLEPRLVASAAVARALENDDDSASVVAGAVLSAEFSGLRSPVVELSALARAAQATRFRSLRKREPMPRTEFAALFNALPAFSSEAVRPGDGLERLASATTSLAQQLERAVGALGQRFESRLDAADEEIDVLWWAFSAPPGGTAERQTPDALLRAGLELADRHRFRSEIPTAREILRRVLGAQADTDHQLAEVVAGAGGRVPLDEAPAGPLFPVLTCNAACVALQGEGEWVAAAGRLGVDPTIHRRGDEIAAQTLRELLLVRSIGA